MNWAMSWACCTTASTIPPTSRIPTPTGTSIKRRLPTAHPRNSVGLPSWPTATNVSMPSVRFAQESCVSPIPTSATRTATGIPWAFPATSRPTPSTDRRMRCAVSTIRAPSWRTSGRVPRAAHTACPAPNMPLGRTAGRFRSRSIPRRGAREESAVVHPKVSLARLGGKRVEAAFDGGLLTSDSGVMLLREVEARLGLLDRIVKAVGGPSAPRVCSAPFGGPGPSARVSDSLWA